MAEVSIQIKKSRVSTDVFRITCYAAAKLADAGENPCRVFDNESNCGLFEQFVPSAYDTNLNTSFTNSFFSYLINSIASKWFAVLTLQEDAAFYARQAEADANNVWAKIYYSKTISQEITFKAE
ncbi:MAG: hypothetical protein PHT87_07755 [Bacteroidales bacterium]|nr:hypothetical protein [Bacteroidales bacterium]MDD4641763.1 hypothetical protein [Bacteroidales bacterium]